MFSAFSAADGLAGTDLEQHIVGNHHRGGAADLEQADDMLDEVELLVLGGSPEVLSLVAVRSHLQKQQVGELFQVVAARQAVVAEHVAEVPQLLHHGLGVGVHQLLTVSERGDRFQLAVASDHVEIAVGVQKRDPSADGDGGD